MVSRLDRTSIGITTAISLAIGIASAYYVPQINTNGKISAIETAYARIDEKQIAQGQTNDDIKDSINALNAKIDNLNDNLTSLLIVNGIKPKK